MESEERVSFILKDGACTRQTWVSEVIVLAQCDEGVPD